jgi:hypothetical protein
MESKYDNEMEEKGEFSHGERSDSDEGSTSIEDFADLMPATSRSSSDEEDEPQMPLPSAPPASPAHAPDVAPEVVPEDPPIAAADIAEPVVIAPEEVYEPPEQAAVVDPEDRIPLLEQLPVAPEEVFEPPDQQQQPQPVEPVAPAEPVLGNEADAAEDDAIDYRGLGDVQLEMRPKLMRVKDPPYRVTRGAFLVRVASAINFAIQAFVHGEHKSASEILQIYSQNMEVNDYGIRHVNHTRWRRFFHPWSNDGPTEMGRESFIFNSVLEYYNAATEVEVDVNLINFILAQRRVATRQAIHADKSFVRSTLQYLTQVSALYPHVNRLSPQVVADSECVAYNALVIRDSKGLLCAPGQDIPKASSGLQLTRRSRDPSSA